MKHIKTALSLLLAAMLLCLPALAIELDAGTGDGFYVQDTANVLSSTTEALVAGYNATLESECDNAQIVVVTVNYLEEDTQVASLQLLNDWGVGSAGNSNGMLLLLVSNEYRGWLSTGDGIDGVFDDDMVDEYLNDYFWDYIDNDQFDEGVQSLVAALYDWYLSYYGVDAADAGSQEAHGGSTMGEEPPMTDYNKGGNSMILSLLVILAIIWLCVSANRYGRMRGWGYGGGFWPIFWFGGHRMYRDWYDRHGPGPGGPGGGRGPGGPGGGRGPGGPGGGGFGGGRGPGGPGGGRGPGGPGGGRGPGGPGGFGGGHGGGFGGGHGGGFGGGGFGGGFGGHGGGGGGGRH